MSRDRSAAVNGSASGTLPFLTTGVAECQSVVMRIASVSDLHTDHAANRDAVVAIAAEIHRRSADVVVIAGDISHKNDRIDRVLRAFREVADVVAYIPGNHDVWYEVPSARARADLNTWTRYRLELRELAETNGVHYLPAGPLTIDGLAIVGTCGWYDYSFALPHILEGIDERALSEKKLGKMMWTDARFVAFRDAAGGLMSDPEVARQMEAEFLSQLEDVEARPEIEDVVAVTHHLPFADVVHRTGELPWEFFNAFMGSEGLGAVIKQGRKVRAAIYGHTHWVGDQEIDGLRVLATPLGYPRERKGMSEEKILETRIGWIEI